jgi:glycosyltransferase involved in cell wall biosynthesis
VTAGDLRSGDLSPGRPPEPAAAPTADARGARRVLSVVVPVYRNEASLPELLDRLAGLPFPAGIECRAVFVVDGSPDRSAELLAARLPGWSMPATLVVLSRNFGSFAAIRAGLEAADGDYCAVMAADLQEPPELLLSFVERLESGEVDLVLGRREGRADPLSTRITASTFWWLYRRFVQPTMPVGGVDVFACNRTVRTAVLDLEESNSSLIGLLLWLGFRQETVGYARQPRADGKSSWTLAKKLRYMSDSIFSFTDLPIRMLLVIGVVGCIAVTAIGLIVLVTWALGLVDVAGYTPIMLSILFVGGLLTFGLGIVGSYVWRTYDNTKRRPLTVEQSVRQFAPDRP